MEDQKLKSAIYYLTKCGFSVIPCKQDKKPFIAWQQFQKERPSVAQVEEWWGKQYKFANIGIVTGKISNLTIIDIDTPEGKQLISENLPESWLTPCVSTPGGGEHIYCLYYEGIGNTVRFASGCDIRTEGGYVIAPPSSDARGRWCWKDGCKVTDLPRREIPDSILSLIKKDISISGSSGGVIGGDVYKSKNTNVFYARNTVSAQQNVTNVTNRNTNNTNNRVNFDEGSRDESLFHLANCLRKGGMPIEEIEQILTLMATKVCNPPFPMGEIPAKLKSAVERTERGEKSITHELREFIAQQSGNINITLAQQCITNITKQDIPKIRTVLSRLAKEGLLERTGRIAGEYRIVQKDYEVVDAASIVLERGVDIALPFMLEQYVEILPKDLIVIAGTPNAGKTAIMLDMVARNQDKFECWYFSTEMGQQACARRLAQRDPGINWKFKFVQDFGAYEDVIKPDCLNFIDYVEQNEGEAFKIPGILAKIQRKLKTGVAVVALQKNTGKGWGVGGEQTRAKPTLFLSVESNFPGQIIRIEKAKAFKEYNPNGFCMKFKIIKGINLRNDSDWGPELAKNNL